MARYKRVSVSLFDTYPTLRTKKHDRRGVCLPDKQAQDALRQWCQENQL
jgi:hypothetical protein